jgi:pimeloyl-ACP methyl ester carboxylesterase
MRQSTTRACYESSARWLTKMSHVASLLALFSSIATASPADAQPHSVPPTDAPELSQIGAYAVGWQTLTFTNPDQPDIPKLVKTFGIAGSSDRTVKIELWYPAQSPANAAKARYVANLPRSQKPGAKTEFVHHGIAVRDAAPLQEHRFPLVLVSHGFGGWGTFMTYLTENLASKGYVVAAIDHADASFTDAAGFGLSFGSTIVHRARDQRFALDQLTSQAKSAAPGSPLRLIDTQSIGVIGYSMGGFGAIATAGAGYDPASPTFKQIPAKLMAPFFEGNAEFDPKRSDVVKALVLIAPWGGQPANRSWTPKSLGAIRAPIFMLVGDQDDIVEFKEGASHLFERFTGTSRHLLVFQNARHNVGGNPAPTETYDDFVAREYFDEPTWRKDRLNAINQHFITAFLDRNLKGMSERRAFLDLPTVRSNDGKWPMEFGKTSGAAFATANGDSAQYWRGFQRRWATGLEMHRRSQGE